MRQLKQVKNMIRGGVWFFQVKLSNKSDQWHPHIHCVYDGKYIPHDWICKIWLKITGTSNVVDIRMVRNVEKASKDIARYSARPANLKTYPVELRQEIYHALHGKRLVGTWGTAKGVSLSPPKEKLDVHYERLGDWTTILALSDIEPEARQIIKAWLDGDIIPKGFSFQWLNDLVDGGLEKLTIDVKTYREDPQFEFR